MPISKEELENVIRSNFPDAQISLKDLAGDDDHWSVEIIDKTFTGLTRIQQHKLVQQAVAGRNIHALQIKTGS